MMAKTDIEWTDRVWNVVRGCSMISAGCAHCYAMRQAHRFAGPGQPYEGLTDLGPDGPRWTGEVRLIWDRLDEPYALRVPQRIFVNSMSDLFHRDVPFDFLSAVFDVCYHASRHTFQILTKRPQRLLEYIQYVTSDRTRPGSLDRMMGHRWPLPGVWLGVSVEDQATAEARIPVLRSASAAGRWVSAEPLLAQLDLRPYLSDLHWVVVGGETGPGARPCEVAWIRSLIAQCRDARVPVFVKQLGTRVVGAVLADGRGGDPVEWPADLRVREVPG